MSDSQGSSSAAAPATTAAVNAPVNTFGNNRGIRFHIKTGSVRYECTIQDRSNYERMKATRTSSTDSMSSVASSSSSSSA